MVTAPSVDGEGVVDVVVLILVTEPGSTEDRQFELRAPEVHPVEALAGAGGAARDLQADTTDSPGAFRVISAVMGGLPVVGDDPVGLVPVGEAVGVL